MSCSLRDTSVFSCKSRDFVALLLSFLLCGLLFYVFSSISSGNSRRLQQQNASLAQAAAVSRELRELSLQHFSSKMLRSAFSLAGQLMQSSQHASIDPIANATRGQSAESRLLLMKVLHILMTLATAKPVVMCNWDSTLSLTPFHESNTVLLAANMHNNEELLPHFTLQLLDLLSSVPDNSAFVSIYESGSTDSTGAWLEVLQDLMLCLSVPHRIIIGGSLTRAEQQDRIDFLAQARNRALEPLWLTAVHSDPSANVKGSSANYWAGNAHIKASESFASKDRAHPLWQAQKVVFLNDVYFCAQDVLRLLQYKADIACGMDFDRPNIDGLSRQEQQARFAHYLLETYAVPAALGRLLGRSGLVTKHFRSSLTIQAAFKATDTMGFYDTWVARDSDGNLFLKDPPYVTDPYSLTRITKGLPFPVKCCWNGLVAMRADPFSKHNLRIRMHQQGECAASECSLVCDDFHRLGYGNIVVDPGVRQAYDAVDAKDLYSNASVLDLPYTRWAEVEAAAAIDWNLVPHRPYTKCCGLPEGHNMIEFDKDCSWDNFMEPNYTALTLRPFNA